MCFEVKHASCPRCRSWQQLRRHTYQTKQPLIMSNLCYFTAVYLADIIDAPQRRCSCHFGMFVAAPRPLAKLGKLRKRCRHLGSITIVWLSGNVSFAARGGFFLTIAHCVTITQSQSMVMAHEQATTISMSVIAIVFIRLRCCEFLER